MVEEEDDDDDEYGSMLRGFTDHSLDKNLLIKNSLEATRLNDDRAITVEIKNHNDMMIITVSS